jgi:hypothetical protein
MMVIADIAHASNAYSFFPCRAYMNTFLETLLHQTR